MVRGTGCDDVRITGYGGSNRNRLLQHADNGHKIRLLLVRCGKHSNRINMGGLLRLVHTLTGRGNGAHGVFFYLSNDLQWQHLLDFLAVVREKRLDLQFRKTAKQHKGK